MWAGEGSGCPHHPRPHRNWQVQSGKENHQSSSGKTHTNNSAEASVTLDLLRQLTLKTLHGIFPAAGPGKDEASAGCAIWLCHGRTLTAAGMSPSLSGNVRALHMQHLCRSYGKITALNQQLLCHPSADSEFNTVSLRSSDRSRSEWWLPPTLFADSANSTARTTSPAFQENLQNPGKPRPHRPAPRAAK